MHRTRSQLDELHEQSLLLKRLLLVQKTDQQVLSSFFKWVNVWWPDFWCRFRPDGSMTFAEFQDFVHWEGKWDGDTERVFELLDLKNQGFITTHDCLVSRRWVTSSKDMGDMNIWEFRKRLADQYDSNLGRAWRVALDPEDTGHCSFAVFVRECNRLGIQKNLRSLWEELTGHQVSRQISYRDLDPTGDRLLTRFTLALCIKYGSVDKAWSKIQHDCGGNVHRTQFISACHELGIELKSAKWLFGVLDPNKMRYISPYDKLNFLSFWDPGDANQITGMSLAELNSLHRGRLIGEEEEAIIPGNTEGYGESEHRNPFNVSHENPYEIIIELTKEEHTELQRRKKVRALMAGIDVDAERRNKNQSKKEWEQEADAKQKRADAKEVTSTMFIQNGVARIETFERAATEDDWVTIEGNSPQAKKEKQRRPTSTPPMKRTKSATKEVAKPRSRPQSQSGNRVTFTG